ncbi:MAG TPA: DUF1614 domain-containing protein [Thiotrichales bacterium]|nr:DUF1614 domain-containing protein [Thiotrichales bacterium]
MPVKPAHFIVLAFLVVFLFVLLQLQVLGLVLDKLGLSPEGAVTLLFATLIGSLINLPLFKVHGEPMEAEPPPELPPWILGRIQPYNGETLISVNVGGALIPVAFSLYLLVRQHLPLMDVVTATVIVSAVSYAFSQPIKGMGIGMPLLLAPLVTAFTALMLAPDNPAPLAYVSGTLGVLIGADLLHLKDIPRLATPLASIGGAGTFDGIFFTGILAVLLT